MISDESETNLKPSFLHGKTRSEKFEMYLKPSFLFRKTCSEGSETNLEIKISDSFQILLNAFSQTNEGFRFVSDPSDCVFLDKN